MKIGRSEISAEKNTAPIVCVAQQFVRDVSSLFIEASQQTSTGINRFEAKKTERKCQVLSIEISAISVACDLFAFDSTASVLINH